MSKQVVITEEEYKKLRHFWCQTSSKFMELKEYYRNYDCGKCRRFARCYAR